MVVVLEVDVAGELKEVVVLETVIGVVREFAD